MSIKKSSLERKWCYRVVKVFFLLLPLLILLLLLLNGRVITCGISQKNILDILKENIVYIAIGLVSYFLILKAVWRLFLYIVFGGLEDDTKKKDSETIQPVNKATQPAPVISKRAKIMQLIPIIIILGVVAIYVLSEMGYISNVKPTPGPTCFTTSAQMETPCHSVQSGVGVSGVITYDYCDCPSDTYYSGTTDVITPGGPYKICICK